MILAASSPHDDPDAATSLAAAAEGPGTTTVAADELELPPHVLFGSVLARAPDLDRDGCDDLLVGDPGFRARGDDPRVWVMSARNGSVLSQRSTARYALGQGVAFASGVDVDRDGTADWAFACGFAGRGVDPRIVIVSGASGEDLAVIAAPASVSGFGREIAFAPTRDGVLELLASGRDASTGADLVSVHDPRSGRCLRSWPAADSILLPALRLGSDLDGDGRVELVGARASANGRGCVLTWSSSRDGQVVAEVPWESPQPCRFGSFATCPDLDGDGREEWLLLRGDTLECRASASGTTWPWLPLGLDFGESVDVLRERRTGRAHVVVVGHPGYGIAEGQVSARDPATGAVVWERTGTEDDWHFGSVLAPIGDVDRDGVEDLAVGNAHDRSHVQGRFSVVSGRTGKVLRTVVRRGQRLVHG